MTDGPEGLGGWSARLREFGERIARLRAERDAMPAGGRRVLAGQRIEMLEFEMSVQAAALAERLEAAGGLIERLKEQP